MIVFQKTFVVRNLSAIERFPENTGNLVVFDEYVDSHRLRFNAVLHVFEPGRVMVWHLRKIIGLPA